MINLDDLEGSLVSSMVCSGELPCEPDKDKFKKLILSVEESEFKKSNVWIIRAIKRIIRDTDTLPTMNEVELFLDLNIPNENTRQNIISHLFTEVLVFSPMVYKSFEYYLDMFYKKKAIIKMKGI